MPNPPTQQLLSRIGGLENALKLALGALAVKCGEDARPAIEALRKQAIDRMKNSDIDPEWEMKHAEVVRPAIEAINAVFDDVLGKIV